MDTISVPVTTYELTVLDENRQRIPYLRPFRLQCTDKEGDCDTFMIPYGDFHTMDPPFHAVRVHEKESPVTFSFLSFAIGEKIAYTYYTSSWTGTFRESETFVRDTVIINTSTGLRSHAVRISTGKVSFSVLPAQGRNIIVIVTVPEAKPDFSVSLYSLSGRKIGTETFHVDKAGTFTRFWQVSKKGVGELAPGTYLCRLEDAVSPLVTRRITIR